VIGGILLTGRFFIVKLVKETAGCER
jgi:hypothetical protein